MGDVNVYNLDKEHSRRLRERLDNILLILNSEKSNDDKFRELKKKDKKDLRKAIELLDDTRKTFEILSTTVEKRVFNLQNFDSRNSDRVD